MLYEIKHRWTGDVLFALETGSLRLTLEAAVKTGADLTGADLRDADLRDANLTGTILTGADLTGADLTGANLTPIRDDFWAVLSGAPAEVAGLRQALLDGRIDGSSYHGDCACLVGTLANVRGVDIEELALVRPNSSRPIERWFMNIRPGDTPANAAIAQQTLEWLDTWLDAMRAAFAHTKEEPHV